jgi:GTP-binding protein
LRSAAADEIDDTAAAAARTGARDPRSIRNTAVIAHVDHGKSTPTDKVLREQSVELAGVERALDSNDVEREGIITIMYKVTGVTYNDYFINIVDLSGHEDFGAEDERVPSMVNSSLLIVEATEGSMTQAKFVQTKALALYHHPTVFLNKVDRNTARPAEVEFEVFDLFASFDATELQLGIVIIKLRQKGWELTVSSSRVLSKLDDSGMCRNTPLLTGVTSTTDESTSFV